MKKIFEIEWDEPDYADFDAHNLRKILNVALGVFPKVKELSEYCECTGLRINNPNDKNCLRCGKPIKPKEEYAIYGNWTGKSEQPKKIEPIPTSLTTPMSRSGRILADKINEIIDRLNGE